MTQWGLDTLFNPAKRHMDEEKRRLQATREEVGDSSGGRRIDLESGKVRIQREEPVAGDAAAPGASSGAPSSASPDDASGVATEGTDASADMSAAERPRETPAQARARKRIAARRADTNGLGTQRG